MTVLDFGAPTDPLVCVSPADRGAEHAAVAHIVPECFTMLTHAGGNEAQRVAFELVARDLLLPRPRRSAVGCVHIPLDSVRPFYVLRAELGLVDPAGMVEAPAVVQALAALLRVCFATWFVRHPPRGRRTPAFDR